MLFFHYRRFRLTSLRHCTYFFFSVVHTCYSACTNASPTPTILAYGLPSCAAFCFLAPLIHLGSPFFALQMP